MHAHYFGLYSFLHHRERSDFVPADGSGLLPFFWDIPWYLLVRTASPRVTEGVLGGLGGLAVVLTAVLGWRIVRPRSARRSAAVFLVGAMTVFGATGAGFLGEFGTTFGDVATAVPILAGLVIILWTGEVSTKPIEILLGMSLVGIGAGLKLTNLPWAAASVLGLVAAVRGRASLRLLLPALGGMTVGFCAAYGPWAIEMYRDFGSPVFPLFNSIFHSPDYVSTNIIDTRWVLKSPFEILTLPFTWLTRSRHTSEAAMRDWRWFVLLVVALIYSLRQLAQAVRVWGYTAEGRRSEGTARGPGESLIAPDTRRFMITFVFGGVVIALIQLAYTRYLVMGELTAGIAFVCVLDAMAIWKPFNIRRIAAATALVLVLTSSTNSWGKVPFGKSWFRVQIPDPPQHALILVAGPEAYQYVLPFFPSSDRFGAVGDGDSLFAAAYRRFVEQVHAFTGPAYLLTPYSTEAQLGVVFVDDLRALGLRLSTGQCTQVAALTGPLQLCRLSRALT